MRTRGKNREGSYGAGTKLVYSLVLGAGAEGLALGLDEGKAGRIEVFESGGLGLGCAQVFWVVGGLWLRLGSGTLEGGDVVVVGLGQGIRERDGDEKEEEDERGR